MPNSIKRTPKKHMHFCEPILPQQPREGKPSTPEKFTKNVQWDLIITPVFFHNVHNIHPIYCLWGQDLGCLLSVHSLVYNQHLPGQTQHPVILGWAIMVPNCIKYCSTETRRFRVTALIVTGDVEACLQRLQWRVGKSSWWHLWFSEWVLRALLAYVLIQQKFMSKIDLKKWSHH